MTGIDPTTAPAPADLVWRDKDGDYWRFNGKGLAQNWVGDDQDGERPECWSQWTTYSQPDVDAAWGPLVAVGQLPAWTGPDCDVEPDDVPAVTE